MTPESGPWSRREFISRATALGMAAVVASACTPSARTAATTMPVSTTPPGSSPVSNSAELVIVNAKVLTVDDAGARAQAVAIRNGTLTYVGTNTGAKSFITAETEVVDLAGKALLPGFHDSHIHVLEGSSPVMGTCILKAGTPPNEYLDRFRSCAGRQIGTDWVLGWGHSVFDLLDTDRPARLILDDAIPDRPVAMMEETSHSLWVNSMALRLAGIDATTPDPPGGVILHDATGEPSGLLFDNAGDMVLEYALASTPQLVDLNYQGLLNGLERVARNGITSIADARVYWTRGHLEAWQRAEARGRLSARAVLGLWAYPEFEDGAQIQALASMYSDDTTSRLRANQIKVYSDGIYINGTAAMLKPYVADSTAIDLDLGLNYFEPERLAHYIIELETVGFDFHIHAIGDRGVRNALDAIEAAIDANGGDIDRRHRITHLELVDPADRGRFAELGVIADFQVAGEYAQPDRFDEAAVFVGSRANDLIPVRDIWDTGAKVTLSSDWDVSAMNPLVGISRSVDRGPQSLPSIEDAIRAYTLDAAYTLGQDHRTGSIEVGKLADLVVLSDDPTAVPINEVEHLEISSTLVDGKPVHGKL